MLFDELGNIQASARNCIAEGCLGYAGIFAFALMGAGLIGLFFVLYPCCFSLATYKRIKKLRKEAKLKNEWGND